MSTQDENSLQELYEKRIVSRRVTLWQKYKENNGSSQSDGFSDTDITSQALETELKRVADSHAALLADRQSGPHVGATNIQLFAGTLLDFLKGYSTIFGVAQSVDNQSSGGLATNVVAALFVVAVNKNAREEKKIQNALSQCIKTFPRLEEYHEMYSDELLRESISEAYAAMTNFTKACAIYYELPMWRRLVKNFVPPAVDIDLVRLRNKRSLRPRIDVAIESGRYSIESLPQGLNSLTFGFRELRAKRVELESQKKKDDMALIEMQEKINELVRSNTELREVRRSTAISSLKAELGIPQSNIKEGLITYIDFLDKAFSRGKLDAPTEVLHRLSKDDSFKEWETSYPDRDDERVHPSDILWAIVYQIITWQPQLLDNQQLLARIRLAKKNFEFEAVRQIIAECLYTTGGDKVPTRYILIDRLDRIDSNLKEDLLALLLKLTHPSLNPLKILVVSHASSWDPSEDEIRRITRHHRIDDSHHILKRDWCLKLHKRRGEG
ncbi:hypothetical protein IFR04_004478 [Cadophora malorum]|uniref:Uncharacterized protein n=1 Tax=Cadophora malorum TaxID=108018 RepID=A0A8H7WCK2_9HELO|nr:hypothetical protein IFR04_004478 [Cadophora malorum]